MIKSQNMKKSINKDKIISPLERIKRKDGYILKLINKKNKNYNGFGEVYFSKVNYLKIRAWKLHKQMYSNLFVVKGRFLFAVQKDIKSSTFFRVIIDEKDYKSIFIQPNIWFGFQGLSKKENLLMNLSNIIHNDKESQTISSKKFEFRWNKK